MAASMQELMQLRAVLALGWNAPLSDDDCNRLGSGLIDHSQKMTAAAMQMAEKKVCAHRS